MPSQLWDTGEILQFQAAPTEPPRAERVWIMSDAGVPEIRDVMVGITDESLTEVVSGNLREGEVVIVSDSLARADEEEDSGGNQGPFRFRR